MKPTLVLFGLILISAVACSPTAGTTVQNTDDDTQVIENTEGDAQTVIEPTTATTGDDTEMQATDIPSETIPAEPIEDAQPDEMPEEPEAVTIDYNGPAWTNLELVNANTGETFTLADFAGKTVFIEPMATWCTNCRGQQRRINEVADQLSADEYVILSLSVETYLTPEELAAYAINNEFGWTFAVASEELLGALVEQFGRSVSSPPSVPHFTISADGTAGNFSTGAKSADEFLALVQSVSTGS